MRGQCSDRQMDLKKMIACLAQMYTTKIDSPKDNNTYYGMWNYSRDYGRY